MKTLLKNARILSMRDDNITRGDVVILDNKIIYVGQDSDKFAPFDIVREINGNLLMPSFKNAHTHSAMTFLRSKTDDFNLQDWLFKVVIPREDFLTEEDVYAFSKVAFLEYLTTGVSACFDQYYFPLSTGKAAKEMGMRCVLLGTYNSLYSKEDIKNLYHQINDEDGLVKYYFGIHAEYTCPDSELKIMNEVIHEKKAPFFTHISETEKEVKECYERRGMSPVQFLASQGLYDFGGGGYHCCHFDEKDIKIFRNCGLSVVTCPGSNTKLA
ncbi:MAG: amidohydrolase family protein, partial [Bacilli bacterium]|nr:amidohydrolase family protein [Bacilli bacterium]